MKFIPMTFSDLLFLGKKSELIFLPPFFSRVLELQGNIRVICRVRPVLEIERKMGEDVDVTEILSEV